MRKLLCSQLLGIVILTGQTVPAVASNNPYLTKPTELYGEQILFDVYRAGSPVGFHRVQFEKGDEGLRVRSDFQLEIQILFFTAYRYRYTSEAAWRDGILESLDAQINDDGKMRTVNATRDGQRMLIKSPDGDIEVNSPLFPTNHWNIAVVDEDNVLNTLTGRVNTVRISPQDRGPIATENGPVSATRFVYSGDLENEVWYDDDGRWVKMRFKGIDGSIIEYVCRLCQGGPIKAAP